MLRSLALSASLLVVGLASIAFAAPTNKDVDLTGKADLLVRQDMLGGQWLVRTEDFTAAACSVIEGGVQPGTHDVVRFTVGVANIGDADVFVGNPQDHVNAGDNLFEFALCHQHYHFRNYVKYELIDASGHVWRAAKRGFCMLDTDPNPAWLGEPARAGIFLACGTTTTPGFQGISHGWTDTYRFDLGGQYFVLDGGDGQPTVPPGDYILRITANPPYDPDASNPCRFLDPATGKCHALEESNYNNNVAQVTLRIPAHSGRDGVGPLAPNSTKSASERVDP
jgi:lysyl oxidase